MLNITEKKEILKKDFEQQGFIVGDGLKYGVDIVLYTDSPDKVHSKYGVLIYRNQSFLDLIAVQRTCASANKKLIVVSFIGKNYEIVKYERETFKNEEQL